MLSRVKRKKDECESKIWRSTASGTWATSGRHRGGFNQGCPGHELIVAHPRKLRMIFKSEGKNEQLDARQLARVARMDPRLARVCRLGKLFRV